MTRYLLKAWRDLRQCGSFGEHPNALGMVGRLSRALIQRRRAGWAIGCSRYHRRLDRFERRRPLAHFMTVSGPRLNAPVGVIRRISHRSGSALLWDSPRPDTTISAIAPLVSGGIAIAEVPYHPTIEETDPSFWNSLNYRTSLTTPLIAQADPCREPVPYFAGRLWPPEHMSLWPPPALQSACLQRYPELAAAG